MFTRYEGMRDAFKAAIDGLPNYKRGNAWEFVKALESRIEALDAEVKRLDVAARERVTLADSDRRASVYIKCHYRDALRVDPEEPAF